MKLKSLLTLIILFTSFSMAEARGVRISDLGKLPNILKKERTALENLKLKMYQSDVEDELKVWIIRLAALQDQINQFKKYASNRKAWKYRKYLIDVRQAIIKPVYLVFYVPQKDVKKFKKLAAHAIELRDKLQKQIKTLKVKGSKRLAPNTQIFIHAKQNGAQVYDVHDQRELVQCTSAGGVFVRINGKPLCQCPTGEVFTSTESGDTCREIRDRQSKRPFYKKNHTKTFFIANIANAYLYDLAMCELRGGQLYHEKYTQSCLCRNKQKVSLSPYRTDSCSDYKSEIKIRRRGKKTKSFVDDFYKACVKGKGTFVQDYRKQTLECTCGNFNIQYPEFHKCSRIRRYCSDRDATANSENTCMKKNGRIIQIEPERIPEPKVY